MSGDAADRRGGPAGYPADGAAAEAGWRLERAADGRLAFVATDGTRHDDVDVRRGFPLSAPLAGVAVVGGGVELAWIPSLRDVAGPLRRVLDEELARREFVPVIERIEAISETRPAEWRVTTDRGRHRFDVVHAEDVARQADGSVYVTDADGIRYVIADVAGLDSRSRRLLERSL